MILPLTRPRSPPPTDFAGRLNQARPGVVTADPGMVAPPPADPGFQMPNVAPENLNQAPGVPVAGTLPAAATLPLVRPPTPVPVPVPVQTAAMAPTMTDANDFQVNVGDQRSDPVFSNQEWQQGMLWNQMDTARMLYQTDPTAARRQTYGDASAAYLASAYDPNLPANRLQARLDAEGARAPADANTMMQAVQNRMAQRRGP